MPGKYVNKNAAVALLLLGWGDKHAEKYGTPDEIAAAKQLLRSIGYTFGKCKKCGKLWYVKEGLCPGCQCQ